MSAPPAPPKPRPAPPRYPSRWPSVWQPDHSLSVYGEVPFPDALRELVVTVAPPGSTRIEFRYSE